MVLFANMRSFDSTHARETFKNAVKALPGTVWAVNRMRSWSGRLPAEGPEGVKSLGHRSYVGGRWDEIGRLQFDFLVSRGLLPNHYLLDIACGSLRAGVHFISYLESHHYLGIEKEDALLKAGIAQELRAEDRAQKQPEFVISSEFEFDKFSAQPDYALAQSLFTHLPPPLICDCLSKLRRVIRSDGSFYATFIEVSVGVANPGKPHDHGIFEYRRGQMEQFGRDNGWLPEYIGDWNHPRQQKMMLYKPV